MVRKSKENYIYADCAIPSSVICLAENPQVSYHIPLTNNSGIFGSIETAINW